jgi:CSLREA domain-containing protein
MNFTHMLVALVLSVCFGALPITTEAVTFNVNSTDDAVETFPGDGLCATVGGVCTLRAAIQEANALATADTIVLKAKKYYLTIPGEANEASATGDLDITDSLTIRGVSSAQTIINGGALDRVFEIIGPVVVRFINLSIQNGFKQTDIPYNGGAGIGNFGGTVYVTSCSVANNIASGSAEIMGGGIFSTGAGSSLYIESSSVINNMVTSTTSYAFAGGIGAYDYDGGTLRISASKIAYNSATSATFYTAGGGILSSGAGSTITNSKILANSAISISGQSFGGGIALIVDSTAAVISGTNISKNSSTSFGVNAWGGGLYFQDETATVSSCTIKGNRANAPASGGLGGGIAGLSSNITIKNASAIESNLASFDGGGIKNVSGWSTITVSPNSTVVNNMPNDQN